MGWTAQTGTFPHAQVGESSSLSSRAAYCALTMAIVGRAGLEIEPQQACPNDSVGSVPALAAASRSARRLVASQEPRTEKQLMQRAGGETGLTPADCEP